MGVVSCGTTMLDEGVFENIGAVTWDTTVKTSGFTSVSGNGYFCNTTSAAFTVTLPASPSAGNIVGIKDYANTADTNNITIGRNGSNIQGTADDFKIVTEGGSVLLVYIDSTKGWLVTSSSQASNILTPQFVTATGGTIATSGDYKIHTFTGPGTFTVCSAGNAAGSDAVDYLVVAGGGGGAGCQGAGGGAAGGYRETTGCGYTSSPLGCGVSALPVAATGYPIVIGGGGAGSSPAANPGTQGSNSTFSSITSTGGGYGGAGGGPPTSVPGGSGGSGGGGGGRSGRCGGTGNTPSVTPAQGSNGGTSRPGTSPSTDQGGGGGGASAVGGNGTPSASGAGGAGATSSINATSTTRAGGGSGGSENNNTGAGGSGGGGSNSAGSTNTGGGGAGRSGAPVAAGYAGGSGIVIIRYKFQ